MLILCGPPGSGKRYLARRLCQEFPDFFGFGWDLRQNSVPSFVTLSVLWFIFVFLFHFSQRMSYHKIAAEEGRKSRGLLFCHSRTIWTRSCNGRLNSWCHVTIRNYHYVINKEVLERRRKTTSKGIGLSHVRFVFIRRVNSYKRANWRGTGTVSHERPWRVWPVRDLLQCFTWT